ncbi:MAG: aminotransferase class III-fold pyridoxal phosphate-dependent enzyme, partial [Chloroflexota bacterium]|nr:aminotransferase class III-fold pyridoxal phosphate-dependent enzyme [Chloroflexota bacterium]
VSATGQPHYQELFEPIPTGFTHVPYNDLEAIKSATDENTVAVMLEPVQGEGGVNIPDPDYLPGVRDWCDQNNILLIFDEVQTGLGRLGTLFGYQNFEVEPDIITLAKGLGGGVPIGAFMAKDSACAFDPGDHGSTFGGNPLTCAAAHASTKYILDNNVSENAAKMGEYLGEGLRKIQANHEFITDVRGMGLLWAVEFDSDITPDVIAACNESGLLMNPMRPNTVRLMPVLTITEAEIDEALERLEEGIRNATS